MRQFIKENIGDYSFDASLKKVTITGIPTLAITDILYITHKLSDKVIFRQDKNGNFYAGLGGSIVYDSNTSSNILTLDYDTTSMNNNDKLLIWVDTTSIEYWATDVNTINLFYDHKNYGLYLKVTDDSNGDKIKIEWYKNYNESTKVYSDLAIKETRTYTRDSNTGLVTKKVTNFEYYLKDDTLGSSKNHTKYYNAEEGYEKNMKSRKRLVKKASMWLHGDLIAEFGVSIGEGYSKEFQKDVKSEITLYERSNIQPLLDAVQASIRAYMTSTRKATIDGLLNVLW